MPLIALSASIPFPYVIVILATVMGAASPVLYRYYTRNSWRIPLWHTFPLFSICGLLVAFLPSYLSDSYELKKLYWLYDHGFYPGPNVPTEAELAILPYKVVPLVILELGTLTMIPAVIACCVLYVITIRMAGSKL